MPWKISSSSRRWFWRPKISTSILQRRRRRSPASFISGRGWCTRSSTRSACRCCARSPLSAVLPRRSCWCWRCSSWPKANSREQRDVLKPHRFGEPEHQVHVLHRLARRAFGEVVERRDDDGAAGDAVGGNADEDHVGTAHVPSLRCLAERQHMDERLLRVSL